MTDPRRNPSQRELRWFGLLLLAFFALVGAILLWRFAAARAATGFGAAGVALAALYYALRPLRLPMYRGWMRLFRPLGWVVMHLSLAAVYFLILTPVGIASRAFGVRHLGPEVEPEAKTYWTAGNSPREASSYFEQF